MVVSVEFRGEMGVIGAVGMAEAESMNVEEGVECRSLSDQKKVY